MNHSTYRVALGGLLSAAALAVMFLGSVIPFATFSTPAIASLCVFFFCVEYGRRFGLLSYAAIALLALLLAPDKEAALLFLCFFGYYPAAKGLLEQKLSPLPCWVLKFAVFNSSMLIMYYVITHIIVVQSVADEFAGYTTVFVLALLALANITFFIFDIALTRLLTQYLVKIRPRLERK